MLGNDFKYGDVTERIIGCAMRVHRYFGLGFPEVVCKRALVIELENDGLRYKTEVEKDIYYRGKFIGKRRLDLIIDEKILIALKAIKELDKSYYNQILNYLKIFDLEIGLLLNFGTNSLQFKRFINSRKNP